MKKWLVVGGCVGFLGFAAAFIALMNWLDVNESRFNSPAELGPNDYFPPALPQDASDLVIATVVDNATMACRFRFVSREWMRALQPSRNERLGWVPRLLDARDWDPSLVENADVRSLRSGLHLYCYQWPAESPRGGQVFFVAVDDSASVAYCWWPGSREPSCQ